MTKQKTPLISTTELVTSVKGINTLIDTAIKDTIALQRVFQIIGCSVLKHLAEHKDIRILRNLFLKMPDSLNINSMKEFFNKYGTVRFDDEGEVHYDSAKTLQLGVSMESPWWKAKKSELYKPFNFNVELDKLLKRANGKLEKPKEGDEVTIEQLQAIRTVFYSFKQEATVDTAETLPTLSDVA